MKTRRWPLLLAGSMSVAVGAWSLSGIAQPTSQPGEGGGRPPFARDGRGMDDRGGHDDDERGPHGRGGGGGPGGMRGGGPGGGPMGRGGPGGPGGMRMPSADVMRNYMELVDRYAKLSSDPDAAGVSAVLAANDVLRARGADAGIAYFTKQLDEVKRPAIRRAIRLQLIDLYRGAGKADEALAQMELLMEADSNGGEPTTMPAR